MKRSLGVLLSLFALAAPLKAQMVNLPALGEVSRENRTMTWGWLDDNVMGFTICLDKPMTHGTSFILAGQTEIDRTDTEVHEAVHRAQYERFGSCAAFEDYFATPRGHLLMETEAYAAGVCSSVSQGADRVSVEHDYSERIAYSVMGGYMYPKQVVPILQWYERKGCPGIFQEEVTMGGPNFAYPVYGFAVYSQGTLLAGHGWHRDSV